MILIQRGLLLFILLLQTVTSVPQDYLPSNKYISTGVFQITSTPFSSATVNNLYTVAFSGYVRSSNAFKVGFSLYSLDIKFNDLNLQFDLQVQSTSTTGFQIKFSSFQANLVSFMKICYITKEPSYSDIFYIQTYRYTGSPFTVTNSTSKLITDYPLAASLPTGSLPNIIERSFLNAWNIDSTVSGPQNNIDVYLSSSFPNQNTIRIMIQTSRDTIVVNFYSITVVYFYSVLALSSGNQLTSEVKPSALTQYYIDSRGANIPGIYVIQMTTTMKMFDYNTFIGLKTFDVRTYQTPNFLNFRTVFTSDTNAQFPSLNVQSQEYMMFSVLVLYQKICPPTEPYFVVYLADCVVSCLANYLADADKNCIANIDLKLSYIIKQPDSNIIEMIFNLSPNDPSYNTLYSQIDWKKAISLDIQTISQTTQYIASPDPQLKITIEYKQDLESQDKTITIAAYDSSIYPVNFKSFPTKNIKISSMTSQNNLAINYYPDSAYQIGKIISYLAMGLSAIYMLFFLAGFVFGKVYILEMTFIPQVTFLSLIGLNNISPSMAGLGFLKYVFGYSYTQLPTNLNLDNSYGQGQNYMSLIGMSKHFIFNFNAMFVFNVVAFVLFIIFYVKSRRAQEDQKPANQFQQTQQSPSLTYQFFSLDTLLYLVLWFGVWILFAGQIQVVNLLRSSVQKSLMDYLGIAFFGLNASLYVFYLVVFMRNIVKIRSFYQCFSFKNSYQKAKQNTDNISNKSKYFYGVYFVQKIIIASLFVFLSSLKFINCIIAGLNFVMVVLLIIFKPYKFQQKQGQSKQQETIFKPNIRQALNYIISIAIQMLFFITNQIQKSSFIIYVPLIILCLLIVQIVLTIFFLIKDGVIKQDISALKKMFAPHKQTSFDQIAAGQTTRKLDSNQIKIQLLKNNPDLMKYKKTQFNHNQKSIDERQQQSDQTVQKKSEHHSRVKVNYENDFQHINQFKPKQILSIDQMLQLMAQKNHMSQLRANDVTTAFSLAVPGETTQSKMKQHKQIMESGSKATKGKDFKYSNSSVLDSQWDQLQDVDSSRMDKLIQFNKKKLQQQAQI